MILDLGIHVLDLARYFLGDVERVYCETQKRNPAINGEDTATIMLKHTSGAVSVVTTDTVSVRPLPHPFQGTVLT